MRFHSFVGLGVLSFASFAVIGCADDEQSPTEELGSVQQEIIGGTLDTGTNAVVAVGLSYNGSEVYGVCTGSLIHVDRTKDVAYVLTAAHCTDGTDGVRAADIRFGTDWRAPERIIPVASIAIDERYDRDAQQLEYDFAMIGLRNLPNSLPTPLQLPTANSDGVSRNTTVRVAGYGNTSGYGLNNGRTRRRYTKNLVVDDASSTRVLRLRQPGGGVCDGDSGGPTLLNNTVVAVQSYVFNTRQNGDACHEYAVSSRTRSGIDFINSVLNGTPPPQPDPCVVCQSGAQTNSVCVNKGDTCQADSSCSGLLGCLQNAQSSQQQNQCIRQFPEGIGPLLDWIDCPCSDVCQSECQGSSACENSAQCGFEFAAGSYNECMTSSCCAEMDRAFADGVGYRCITDSTPPAGCEANSAYQAFVACGAANCDEDPSSEEPVGEEEEEEAPQNEEEDEEAPAKKKKKKAGTKTTTTTTGCHAPAGDPSWLLALGALGLFTRRRK